MLLKRFRFRSTRTGQYVTEQQANANQDTTVAETQHATVPPTVVMRALERSLRVNGIDNTLERLAD